MCQKKWQLLVLLTFSFLAGEAGLLVWWAQKAEGGSNTPVKKGQKEPAADPEKEPGLQGGLKVRCSLTERRSEVGSIRRGQVDGSRGSCYLRAGCTSSCRPPKNRRPGGGSRNSEARKSQSTRPAELEKGSQGIHCLLCVGYFTQRQVACPSRRGEQKTGASARQHRHRKAQHGSGPHGPSSQNLYLSKFF